jgi:hypothetical protein
MRNARFQIENELHNYEIRNSLQQPTQMLQEIKSEIDEAARDPWRSSNFTGELPPANSGDAADGANRENAPAAAAQDPAADEATNTGSPASDGPAKPRD